jgi:hypothetical protein
MYSYVAMERRIRVDQYIKGNLDMNCLTKRERNDKRRAICHK